MQYDNPFETSENPFSDPYVPSNDASFVNQCQKIKDDIETYKTNVDYIKQLQYKQMNSVSENDKQEILKELDNANMNMKSLQSQIKNNIESLKFQVDKSDPDMINQLNNLNRLFRGALREMIVEEDNFKEAVTNQAVEQYQIVNPNSSYQEAQEFVLYNGTEEVFSNSLELQNKKAEALEIYQNVKYRHDELLKIQEMATSLNQMFNDLQDLVLEQDEVLNNANNQINVAQTELEKGDANVVQAVHTSKKNRKCKWIIFVLIILLACIIAGVVAGLVKGLRGH